MLSHVFVINITQNQINDNYKSLKGGYKMSRSFIKIIKVLCLMLMFMLVLVGCGGGGNQPATNTGNTGDSSGQATTMQPVNLRFAHFFSATHLVEVELAAKWKEYIEEATDGLVTITTYPGQTLSTAAETYEAIASGLADMGHSVLTYSPGRFPTVEGLEMPGIFYLSSKAASYVARDLLFGMMPEELQDTKLMFVHCTGPSHIASKVPVRSLDDIQNMEVRTFGTPVKTFEALGAVPVSMTQGETYEALARGIVQATCVALESLKGFRQAEVTQYVTYTPFLSNAVFYCTMNLDVWNSFPPDIQEKIEAVNDRIFTEIAAGLWDFLSEEGLEYAKVNYGHEEFFLSDEEIDRWLVLLDPLLDEYIRDMEAKGYPGREIIEEIQRLAEKYNALYPIRID
jgi:TRAP-type C4-dicarboxylate transport system substrate-binding protein